VLVVGVVCVCVVVVVVMVGGEMCGESQRFSVSLFRPCVR